MSIEPSMSKTCRRGTLLICVEDANLRCMLSDFSFFITCVSQLYSLNLVNEAACNNGCFSVIVTFHTRHALELLFVQLLI